MAQAAIKPARKSTAELKKEAAREAARQIASLAAGMTEKREESLRVYGESKARSQLSAARGTGAKARNDSLLG